jgi:hypothetical protein
MEDNDKFKVVISAFKSYLDSVKSEFSKNLVNLDLKKVEIKNGK